MQVSTCSVYFRVLDLTWSHRNLFHEVQQRFFKGVSIKQKNKQTEELLKPVIFTAQFATLILHLKVTGIPVCTGQSSDKELAVTWGARRFHRRSSGYRRFHSMRACFYRDSTERVCPTVFPVALFFFTQQERPKAWNSTGPDLFRDSTERVRPPFFPLQGSLVLRRG